MKADLPVTATLEMRLGNPGMGPLHRAGLGGLAATLAAWRRAGDVSAVLRADGTPPWTVTATAVTLDFGEPDCAADFLRRLFAFAFAVRDNGLIELPGQHAVRPGNAVLAKLQSGLTLTFLQHGKSRTLAKEAVPYSEDVGENEPVEYAFKPCSKYRHQDGWKDLVDGDTLDAEPAEVAGPLSPGSAVRHVSFTGDTGLKETPERLLPLYFALVGCVALTDGRGAGVLLVPEVNDLVAFARYRPAMTPRRPVDCEIGGAGDAALQMQLRVLAEAHTADAVPAVQTMLFRTTAWASQQKSRVMTLRVPGGDDRRLERFRAALSYLPPRLAHKVEKVTTGKGGQKQTTETKRHFWVNSMVRPLAADNLARGKPWYGGFTQLIRGTDRNKLGFEREGLIKMANDEDLYDDPGETAVVRCVHAALRSRYGQIAKENEGKPTAMQNRFSREYERWRLVFAGSKTADQFRHGFADLVSRGGPGNKALQQAWQQVLPLLGNARWQQARDLALLALASYESVTPKTPTEPENA